MKRFLFFKGLVLVFLLLPFFGSCQIYAHDFGTTTISTHPYSIVPNIMDSNLSNSSWTNSTGNWVSYGGRAGQAISLSNSSGTPVITLTFDVNAGYKADISSFNFWRQRSADGAQNWSMTINGISVGSGIIPTTGANVLESSINGLTGLTGTVTIKITLSGATGNGTFRLDDFIFNGTVFSTLAPMLKISGIANNGSVCPGVSASPVIYTITNNGTSASGVSVSSGDAQFAVSGLSSATIPANGGTATFNAVFTPASAGTKSSLLTVSSTTIGSNSATYPLTGMGISAVAPTVTSSAATSVTSTTTTLNGNLTSLGTCILAAEKGFVYSLSSANSNPQVLGIGVTKTAVTPLDTTGAYTLGIFSLVSSSSYSFTSYVFDGTNYHYGTVRTFTTLCGTPTPNGTISNTKNCGSTDLVYNFASGEPAGGITYYWQTASTGTSTTNPVTPSVANPAKSNPYNVTNAATYYVRGFDGTCWGTPLSSGAVSVDALPSISAPPSDQTVQAGSMATFSVTVSGINTKQWQISTDSGVNWTDVPGTGNSYVTVATVLADEGKKYRVIVSNGTCQVISAPATLYVSNIKPNNASISKSCIGNNQITLNWTAPATGEAPTGYIVFALPGTAEPSMSAISAGNAGAYIANTNFGAASTYGALGKAVFKGNATNAIITGLTNLSQYTFKVVAYNGETQTGWAGGISVSGGWNKSYIIDVPEVTNSAASVATNSSVVSWNVVPASSDCYEYMVVANEGVVVFTPFGSGYIANSVYSLPNQVVYKGVGNTITVTGLTEGLHYCYKVFVREVNSNQWSDGVAICQTTGLSYCSNGSLNGSDNGITGVEFNTINNTSVATPSYTDFTAISTNVVLGESYDLAVKVKTYGSFTSYVKAWVDWNRNGAFDSGESYDLGTALNISNNYTTDSPITISVPTGAVVGFTRMRIISRQEFAPTPCTSFDYGEVEDYTLNITKPGNPEINIKGNNITIPSGSMDPNGLNFTQFGIQDVATSSLEKEYFIQNLGLVSLSLTGVPAVKLEGLHPTDFTVTQQPLLTTLADGQTTSFKIKFNPSSADVLSAIVSIANTDPTGNENPYLFKIQGTGRCNTVPAINMTPDSGPSGTVVTLNSSVNDLTGATVKLNGLEIIPESITTNLILLKIPAGSHDGNITVRLKTGCVFTQAFHVITEERKGCEGSIPTAQLPADLILYEVYDDQNGSGGFVSIYNGTSSAKNLQNYEIYRAKDAATIPVAYTTGLSGIILPGELKIIRYSGANNCVTPGSTNNGSFGSGFNGEDVFQLRSKDGVIIYDAVQAPINPGYYLKRSENQFAGSISYIPAYWVIMSLVKNQCVPAGITPTLPVGNSPSVKVQPTYIPDCQSLKLKVTALEGYVGGNPLTYQWYYLVPNTLNWVPVSDIGVYSGSNTSELTIASASGLNDYQYYAQVRENMVTCYTVSNSVQIKDTETKWTAAGWTNGIPNATSKVILERDWDTDVAVNGNLIACSLILAAGKKLTIRSGTNVTVAYEVINNATADNFVVENDGNLVQVKDIAPANIGDIKVIRNSNLKRLDYTYWTSPVKNQNLKSFSSGTVNSRFYIYNEGNDLFEVINPLTNIFGNNSTGFESAAKGYAIRADNNYPVSPEQIFNGVFKGLLNNGTVTFPLKYHSMSLPNGTGDGYNLVGNPYASNIDFYNLADNNSALINKTAYFWTNLNPNPAMQGSNYPNGGYYNNYAVLSGTGGIPATLGTNNNIKSATPTEIIKVGQGFLVKAKLTGNLTFKNDVRTTASNSIFFNKGQISKIENKVDRYWLHLTTPLNVITTVLVGYVEEATNNYEADYDADLFGLGADALFTKLDDHRLGIQGRQYPMNISDVVKVGTHHYEAGIYHLSLGEREGIFADGQNVYLKDLQTNTVTNLSEGSYSFTANQGLSEGRFEIVYQPEVVLGINSSLKETFIIYRDGGDFVLKSFKNITEVEMYDSSGRLIVALNSNEKEIRLDVNKLVGGIYILKITQEGRVFTRKIRK